MAHPMAGVAAMSAIGIGFASQAMGVWFGAMSGAAAASQRLFSPMFDEHEADAFREPRTPEKRAEAGVAKLVQKATVVPLKQRGSEAAELKDPVAPKKVAEVVLPPVPNTAPAAPTPTALRKTEAPKAAKAKFVRAKADAPTGNAVANREALEASKPVASAKPAAAVAAVAKLKPAMTTKPEHPDDLKAITGLGPKVEQVLNGLGVWTYAQVAAWNDAEIAWVDDILGFNGRIQRDDWLGQAKSLAAAKG